MKDIEKTILKTDVNLVLNKMQKDFGKPEVSKSRLITTLRQTFLKSEIQLPHKWSLSAYMINYLLDDLLKELGFNVISDGRRTWVTRLTYIDPCKG